MSDHPIITETKPEAPCADAPQGKPPFAEPKLAFIEPKLTPHGDATKITQGFFGTFTP